MDRVESSTSSPLSENQEEATTEDSPAFCLRPKRSTPRKPNNSGSVTSPNNYVVDRRLSALVIVKRDLFTKNNRFIATTCPRDGNNGAPLRPPRDTLRRGPADSVVSNCPIGPFMESVSLEELTPNTLYENNYISLIIDHEISGENTPIKTEDRIPAPNDRIGDIDPDKTIMSDEGIAIKLYGSYANCVAERGKVIHIAKFRTSPASIKGVTNHANGHSSEIDHTALDRVPFDIIVDAYESNRDSGESSNGMNKNFVPLISIADSIEEPEDPYVELIPVDHKLT